MTKLFRLTFLAVILLGTTLVQGAQTPKYIFLFIGDGMGFNRHTDIHGKSRYGRRGAFTPVPHFYRMD